MDFGLMYRTMPFFIKGAFITFSITALATVLGIMIGTIVAIGRVRGTRIVSKIAFVYVTVLRGVPLLITIFIIYYGLNALMTISPFTCGVIALAVVTGAYLAESIRSGIMAVDPGQFEAASSLALSYAQCMRVVVLPQALRNALPAMGNEFITLLKASSLTSVISVVELTRVANQLKTGTGKPIEMYINATILYLLIVIFFTFILSRLEKKLRVSEKDATT